jgi:hypothetical protein
MPCGLIPDRGDDGTRCVLWLDPTPCEDRGEREELGSGAGEANGGGATSLGIISPGKTFEKCLSLDHAQVKHLKNVFLWIVAVDRGPK